jgi:endonuclease VIII
MPEGPEIRRAADKIAAVIVNRPLQEVWFAFAHLQPYAASLTKQSIIAVDTHGKAMLIRFGNGLTLYTHNQLYGVWMVRKAYNYPTTNRQLRLAIHGDRKSALLYSASDIEILDADTVLAHPFLQRIGPDIFDPQLTVEMVQTRLLETQFRRRGLMTLLLDQRFLAGIGNYLRSEILFVAKIPPTYRPMDCSPEQLQQLAQAILKIPQQSYQTGGITNDLAIAEMMKAQGAKRWQYRHWVFSREGQSCHCCGTKVMKAIASGRRYYYCPVCQSTVATDE